MIECLFGWNQPREERNFAGFFKVDEVRIITADDQDVGWIQEQQVENRQPNPFPDACNADRKGYGRDRSGCEILEVCRPALARWTGI